MAKSRSRVQSSSRKTSKSGKTARSRGAAKTRENTTQNTRTGAKANSVIANSANRVRVTSAVDSSNRVRVRSAVDTSSNLTNGQERINQLTDNQDASPLVIGKAISTPVPFRIVSSLIALSLFFAAGFSLGQHKRNSVVDNAIDTLVANSPDKVNRGILERAAIEAALKASGDTWANYFPKSALQILEDATTNSYSGIGATLRKSRGGVIEVSGVTPKSPAILAGLKVGDQILQINGTDLQGATLTSAIALLRGALGSRVDLLVLRDTKKFSLSLVPKKVSSVNVEATQVATQVGLISIANFSQGTASAVKSALERLKIKEGLIIDLRDNPGGLIDEAVGVAQLFIGSGTIVSYRVNESEKVYSVKNPIPITVPIVAMINKSTASAAEILAGALQDRNRGVIIGERSYGKGSVQEFRTLKDGSKLELTVALYVTPSGRTIEGVGVSPDLAVQPDELGSKALQILGGLASLSTPKSAKK